MMLLLLAVAGSVVDAPRHVGEGVAVVGLVTSVVVGGRGVLSLRPRTVLTGRSGRGNTSGSATPHGSAHPVHVVLLGRVHQVPEQIVVGEVRVVNQSLQVQGDLLGGQLSQLSVGMFRKMFNSEGIGHIGAGGIGIIIIAGIGVVVIIHCTVAKIGHLLNFGLLRRGVIRIHWWRMLGVLHGCNLDGYF